MDEDEEDINQTALRRRSYPKGKSKNKISHSGDITHSKNISKTTNHNIKNNFQRANGANSKDSALKRNRRVFSIEEDEKLKKIVNQIGDTDWGRIALSFENRTARQCRERWITYLSPFVNKKPWTMEEESILIMKYREIGPKWSRMTRFFNGRPDNSIKNHWNSLKRRISKISNVQKEGTSLADNDFRLFNGNYMTNPPDLAIGVNTNNIKSDKEISDEIICTTNEECSPDYILSVQNLLNKKM